LYIQDLVGKTKLHHTRSYLLALSVLPGPLLGHLFELSTVALVLRGNGRDKRIIRVGISQERADRQENLSSGQSGAPLRAENVKADSSLFIDVGVVDLCYEGHLRRLKGVVSGEVNVQEEQATSVGTVTLLIKN